MILAFITSESAYPITPVEPLKAILCDSFGISFCLLYIHINKNKLTYDKFKRGKFGFSILDILYSSFTKLFTSLINTADKEIYNIFIVFYSPITLIQTGQTNINRVLIIKIDNLHM